MFVIAVKRGSWASGIKNSYLSAGPSLGPKSLAWVFKTYKDACTGTCYMQSVPYKDILSSKIENFNPNDLISTNIIFNEN